MNCTRLLETSETLSYGGFYISPENAELLKNSLLILQGDNQFRKCFYWGRINGNSLDYHIAYGYKKDCLKDQVYFYSTDCLNWFSLPKSSKTLKILTRSATHNFEGDPDTVKKIPTIIPLSPEKDPEDFVASGAEGLLKEEDRLAATVEMINEEAMVVPRGSWFKCPNDEIIENPTFSGLTALEASDIKAYLHARLPQRKWNTNLLTRPDYNYAMDFLDTIDLDVPHGCWILQFHLGGQLAILHSLYWPGMIFFHKINTPHYGSLYIGQGKKNMALEFVM